MTREQAKILVDRGLTVAEIQELFGYFSGRHLKVFHEFAKGKVIEIFTDGEWWETDVPEFCADAAYRVKPEESQTPKFIPTEKEIELLEFLREKRPVSIRIGAIVSSPYGVTNAFGVGVSYAYWDDDLKFKELLEVIR